MKENVLDVLMYLFENYMDEESGLHMDADTLKDELTEAGFMNSEVTKAFTWLEDLAALQDNASARPLHAERSVRLFGAEELKKLNVECRGFLLFLEQMDVIDPISREMVIDRVMALESDEIDLEQLKWVVLMVLFNQPGQEGAFTWMENMVLDELPSPLH